MDFRFQISDFRFRVPGSRFKSGFTLIELMVVIALIGILIGGVFRLLGAAGESAKRAETIERLQRLENAISGFHAKYGTYPPVPRHGNTDPFSTEQANGDYTSVSSLEAKNSNRAAHCQPVSFEFPTIRAMDDFIAVNFGAGVYSANVNPSAFDQNKFQWPQVKLFKFGLLSFLLPRYDVIGNFHGDGTSEQQPHPDFFKKAQWTENNKSARKTQMTTEAEACARWLPNLKGLVYGGKVLMGVETGEKEHGYPGFTSAYDQGTGNRYVLGKMTVRDAWGNELYYYSAPPFQSYRLWSAGKDGNTFPPDYPLTALKDSDKAVVSDWVKDDVVRTDR